MTEEKFVIYEWDINDRSLYLAPSKETLDAYKRSTVMENPAGPVISETMVESRVKSHQESAERRVGQILEGVGDQVNATINQLIYEAYTKGLADGFAQRVYANGVCQEVE